MDKNQEMEEWHLEWDNYFDNLWHSIEQMSVLCAKAEKEGLTSLASKLGNAAIALIDHVITCDGWLETQQKVTLAKLYSQNPLFKLLYEKGSEECPFSEPMPAPNATISSRSP